MNLWKLRLSMVTTLAVIFGLSTLVFGIVLSLAGSFNLVTMAILLVSFNIIQWLIGPYLVGSIYRVREMKPEENPNLHQAVADLSRKSGISTPKLMLAQIPLPNAFAYGSPLSGNRVAVTQGLLSNLNDGEVEAVLGHELGHLKHRDVQVMMVVSFLPALFYYIGYSLMLSGVFGGSQQSRSNNNGTGALIGIGFMAFSWLLNLCTLYVSRLREYYADRHSASVVEGGAMNLSSGLAKIVQASTRTPRTQQEQSKNLNGFKSLFIANPETSREEITATYAFTSGNEKLVDDILAKKITFTDNLIEALSTHPNIVKRLRALKELSNNPNA